MTDCRRGSNGRGSTFGRELCERTSKGRSEQREDECGSIHNRAGMASQNKPLNRKSTFARRSADRRSMSNKRKPERDPAPATGISNRAGINQPVSRHPTHADADNSSFGYFSFSRFHCRSCRFHALKRAAFLCF